jgi:hypothetical protein
MTIRHLKIFISVAETGKMSRDAKENLCQNSRKTI